MKKLMPMLLIAVLAITAAPAFGSDIPDEQWVPTNPTFVPMGSQGIGVNENGIGGAAISFLEHLNFDANNKVSEVFACTGAHDPRCAMTSNSWEYAQSVLQWCENDNVTDCLESVTAMDQNGKSLKVTKGTNFPVTNSDYFQGDSSVLLPSGAGNVTVDIPDAPHPAGTRYLARVIVRSTRTANGSFDPVSVDGALFAIGMKTGDYGDEHLITNKSRYGIGPMVIGGGLAADRGCVATTATECAAAYPLPQNIKFGMKYRVSRKLQGWFHGRMRSPETSFMVDTLGSHVEVSAYPIKVPGNSVYIPASQLPQSLLDFYAAHQPWSGQSLRAGLSTDQQGTMLTPEEMLPASMSKYSYQHNIPRYNTTGMEEYLLWLPLFKDVATALPSLWSFRTITDAGRDAKVISCSEKAKSTVGLVTTNATFYLDGPPEFNEVDGTIQYKVASTHFEPDGKTVFQGTYDLVLDSKVARCLYGFTDAPIKAAISVLSSDGKEAVTSSVIKEIDGYLYFAASGFTFSNPTINIKLSQDAPPAPATPVIAPVTPAQPVAPVIAQPKKITITCVKGKTTKKVSALKPTCPSGFKRK